MTGGVDGTAGALNLVLKAMAFASRKHRNQRRKDREASPYINHPIDLAHILANEANISDPVVITAAVLHDTVEDTETTLDELSAEFGEEISAIVAEVTDDRSLPKEERKRLQIEHASALSFRAQQLKLADKIGNLRDLARSPPADWSLERKRAYFDWAARVVEQIPGRHDRLLSLFHEALQGRP